MKGQIHLYLGVGSKALLAGLSAETNIGKCGIRKNPQEQDPCNECFQISHKLR